MSITSYEFLSILQTRSGANADHKTGTYDYSAVLSDVRSQIVQEHAAELAAALHSADAAETLRGLIMKYAAERMAGQDYDSKELVERIYEDMAGLGILTKYLQDPEVEEINGNSYSMIEVLTAEKEIFLYGKDAFASPVAASDIIKRMVRMGGMLLDAQTPKVDSYIGDGIRISASIPPLVPEDKGVVFSIRKQNKARISGEKLISSGCATSEMLEFLILCLCHKVSIGIAGGTGSGKTTLETHLLDEYIKRNEDHKNRIYVIEDSREINLLEFDASHDRPSRVIYNTTSEAWPMMRLVADALRYDPAIIVPAEVRDGAAFAAASAGQTGHTILTSFHANNARDAYKRLTTLCNTANTGLPNETLLDMCIDAWPIIVCQDQLKDNTRKIMEIFEATGQENGHVVGRMLWKFVIEETERDSNGRVTKVRGQHKRTGCISPRLYSYMVSRGTPEDTLIRLFPESVPEDEPW